MKKWILFGLALVVLCGTGFLSVFAELSSTSSKEVSQADPTEIQKALTEAGFYKGTVDGIIGKKTRAAIRAFQEKHGLTVDGVCGSKTWEKLKAYMEEAQEIDAAKDITPEPSVDPVDSLDEDYDIPPSPELESTSELDNEELKQKLIS